MSALTRNLAVALNSWMFDRKLVASSLDDSTADYHAQIRQGLLGTPCPRVDPFLLTGIVLRKA